MSLAEPAISSPIVEAVLWIQGALLGTVATTISILCVAGIGYATLTGRLHARRALPAVVGCFILFGAPVIATALGPPMTQEQVSAIADYATASPLDAKPVPQPSRPAPNPFDPYGG